MFYTCSVLAFFYIQGTDGKVLSQWTCVLESEEGAIFNQFLRFGETRSIVELMIQDLQNQRNVPASPSKTESNIRMFIERMNKTRCQDTFSHQGHSSKCAINIDEGAYDQSHISNSSQSVPSSSTTKHPGKSLNQPDRIDNPSPKRRRQSSAKNEHISVPSIHLANLERTVLNAGSEPTITSAADITPNLTASSGSADRIQNSVPQMRKRSSMKGSHRSMMSRRRAKSAFTVSANRKRVRCNVCNKWFYDKGTWKIHYSAVHLKVTYRCKVEGCNMVFSSLRSRNRHSANPNPKIHRIIEQTVGNGLFAPNPISSGKLSSTITNQWDDGQFEGDTVAETAQISGEELSKTYSQINDPLQENMDSSASISNLPIGQSTKDDTSRDAIADDKNDASVINSHLASPKLPASDFLLNTRTQKRKSNTPVRCLAVDDEDVKVQNHCDDPNSEIVKSGLENDDTSSKTSSEAVPHHDCVVAQETKDKSVLQNSTSVTQNEQMNSKELPESSVIKTLAIKSEFSPNSSNEMPQSDTDSNAQAGSLDGQSSSDHDSKSRITESPKILHPSVPPELAGFSPSVDQMGLNADNCFFLLDGFPTCILCQKSFQSRQGVKVHYQNVHLRMMHTCTIEGCFAAFPSRRSRDRHSSNNNLHRKVLLTNNISPKSQRDESDHESFESNSQKKIDSNSEARQASSDTSGSETSDTVKVKSETVQNPMQPSNLTAVPDLNCNNSSPVKSPPMKPVDIYDSSSLPEGASVPMEANSRQCLPYDSPTLVPPSHAASKLAMIDLWTGPRKTAGGLVCDICMKSYSTKDTLRTHYKNVHIREMHKCTVPGCEMMFSSVRSRNRHSQNPNLHRSFQE